MKVERIATRVSELLAAGDNAQIALARGLLIAHKRTGPFCALVAGRLGKVGPSQTELRTLAESIRAATGDRPVLVSTYPQSDYYWPGRGSAVVYRLYWVLEPVIIDGNQPHYKQGELNL